jgi:hypothetical protein
MASKNTATQQSRAPAPTGMTRQAPLIGIGLKLASTIVFFAMVTVLKIAAERVPIGELVFARNFFGVFPVLMMVGVREGAWPCVPDAEPKRTSCARLHRFDGHGVHVHRL